MSSSQQSEPPSTVSHTDGGADASSARPVIVRIHPMGLTAVVLFLFAVSFPALGNPTLFGWMVAIPVIAAFWVVRVRTTVTQDGLRTRRLFSSRTIEWSEVAGLQFPTRRWARAALVDGTETILPAVTIDDLPRIAAGSGGHVPDPLGERVGAVEEDPDEDTGGDTEQQDDGRTDERST